MIFVASAADAPATPGAYALALRLDAPLDVRIGKNSATLTAGDYLYCGSARGPGGLRARLSRHMRPQKRAHWHVDQITAVASLLGAFVEEQGDECALNAALDDLPIPVAGFGSSDCRRCATHLRFWPEGAALPSRWENARKAARFT
jgi:Uri superfamily endonuclease